MALEKIEYGGRLFALVLRHGLEVDGAQFFTAEDSPLQLGILQRKAGYIEKAHTHKPTTKVINMVQETLYVTKGKVEFDFYEPTTGKKVSMVSLNAGDTILLASGGHALRVIEDFQGVKVKQGPYRGIGEDKEDIRVAP